MTLGELLREAVERLYALWPVRIISDWEQGIRMRHGNAKGPTLTSTNGLWDTGLHFYWPVIGEIISDHVTLRATETEAQTIVSRDGQTVTISFTVAFRIRDLKALYGKVYDDESTVLDRVRAAAGLVGPTLAWDEMPEQLHGAVADAAKKGMHGWGVDLVEVATTNLVCAPAVRLIGSAS
jgi:regulator of protease activity HflC (stomatin/prohibitin superfamily)